MFESKLKNERSDLLAQAFLALETEEDCYRLFEDLFTIREVQDLSSRMEIAQMLRSRETYNVIVDKTGASTAKAPGAGGQTDSIKAPDVKREFPKNPNAPAIPASASAPAAK